MAEVFGSTNTSQVVDLTVSASFFFHPGVSMLISLFCFNSLELLNLLPHLRYLREQRSCQTCVVQLYYRYHWSI